MELGNFSISLNVADLDKSRIFYEALGFSAIGGEAEQGWLILRNGEATVGLFQGMFERNMLTFNPGWNSRCETLDSFADVREIQRHLRDKGIIPEEKIDESGSGPASILVIDPDGNPILIDQHA